MSQVQPGPVNLEELLRVAESAARAGAAVHRLAMRGSVAASLKGSHADLVTEVDREAERQLVSVIRAARPLDAILGEEGTEVDGSSGILWVLDPLDGTTNFVHGYPFHACSVGVEVEGRRALGVVHDTYMDRVYSGVVGSGAMCDGVTLHARMETELERALIGTGFLPNAKVRATQAEVLRAILPRVRDVRRSGCPSLDLCAVASGALDGFYESGLGRWDISAGAAIAEAAGASVVELHSPILPDPLLVATNEKLLAVLLRALEEAGAK